MIWSKTKQNLEGFLSPCLVGRVEYRATGYRYAPDKSGRCYIVVDKKEVFNMNGAAMDIRWYRNEQEILTDSEIRIPISEADIERARRESGPNVPQDRLAVIARNRKAAATAKAVLAAQTVLSKSDFYGVANRFLTGSIESSLDSEEILLNILALIDRRVGKKRLQNMEERIRTKHPIVQYFYELRMGAQL